MSKFKLKVAGWNLNDDLFVVRCDKTMSECLYSWSLHHTITCMRSILGAIKLDG